MWNDIHGSEDTISKYKELKLRNSCKQDKEKTIIYFKKSVNKKTPVQCKENMSNIVVPIRKAKSLSKGYNKSDCRLSILKKNQVNLTSLTKYSRNKDAKIFPKKKLGVNKTTAGCSFADIAKPKNEEINTEFPVSYVTFQNRMVGKSAMN